jgi:hypothetical protein
MSAACANVGDSELVCALCRVIYQTLMRERSLYVFALPFSPVEPPSVDLTVTHCGLGTVTAPPALNSHNVAFACPRRRVQPGGTVTFTLAPLDATTCSAASLFALASAARVDIAIDPAAIRGQIASAPASLLPVSYVPCAERGCVQVSTVIPVSAPGGSRVVVSRASVAGCDITLGSALQVIIGFNHTAEPKGRVYAAAGRGDIPALISLLDDGATTEEISLVSSALLGSSLVIKCASSQHASLAVASHGLPVCKSLSPCVLHVRL